MVVVTNENVDVPFKFTTFIWFNVPVAVKFVPVKPFSVVVAGTEAFTVTVPVAEDIVILLPAVSARTPLFVKVTFPVNEPPPTSPVPTMT